VTVIVWVKVLQVVTLLLIMSETVKRRNSHGRASVTDCTTAMQHFPQLTETVRRIIVASLHVVRVEFRAVAGCSRMFDS